MSTEPSSPQPPSKPSRGSLRVRDMLGALVILLVIAVVGGGVRSCSFSPGGPSVDPGAGPTVDAPARLAEFARVSTFPLRVPTLPEGWRANSTDRGPVEGGGAAVRVGYLSPAGHYLRLVQTDATEENLLVTEAGGPLAGTGVVQAAGLSWVVYRGATDQGEPFRVATSAEGVRLLVTGSGDEPEFRTLVEALVAGQLLPAGSEQN
ncbi:DUF4245 domain-containing protein [Pseudonocardia xishanensis]|uniref:DUF4245 domain-containing protein n=1 Tax=Pseudonocardia xishanensis TaxID=630995 RepID=A0ABP8S4W2_9PSEU